MSTNMINIEAVNKRTRFKTYPEGSEEYMEGGKVVKIPGSKPDELVFRFSESELERYAIYRHPSMVGLTEDCTLASGNLKKYRTEWTVDDEGKAHLSIIVETNSVVPPKAPGFRPATEVGPIEKAYRENQKVNYAFRTPKVGAGIMDVVEERRRASLIDPDEYNDEIPNEFSNFFVGTAVLIAVVVMVAICGVIFWAGTIIGGLTN